eukprot:CAMPEP_0184866516 /NCGR_PEP_ID=MMETSP0580-20130426/22723_1 /TAXON_ID=1118495 /ORGANISM="Dactyliosolen fragilissimus" /LENGTH=616 /DNA_ID=CAMNT_0027366247 /DNA_START=388 /DNA_END=2235 /DNA_ORIENTATION=-
MISEEVKIDNEFKDGLVPNVVEIKRKFNTEKHGIEGATPSLTVEMTLAQTVSDVVSTTSSTGNAPVTNADTTHSDPQGIDSQFNEIDDGDHKNEQSLREVKIPHQDGKIRSNHGDFLHSFSSQNNHTSNPATRNDGDGHNEGFDENQIVKYQEHNHSQEGRREDYEDYRQSNRPGNEFDTNAHSRNLDYCHPRDNYSADQYLVKGKHQNYPPRYPHDSVQPNSNGSVHTYERGTKRHKRDGSYATITPEHQQVQLNTRGYKLSSSDIPHPPTSVSHQSNDYYGSRYGNSRSRHSNIHMDPQSYNQSYHSSRPYSYHHNDYRQHSNSDLNYSRHSSKYMDVKRECVPSNAWPQESNNTRHRSYPSSYAYRSYDTVKDIEPAPFDDPHGNPKNSKANLSYPYERTRHTTDHHYSSYLPNNWQTFEHDRYYQNPTKYHQGYGHNRNSSHEYMSQAHSIYPDKPSHSNVQTVKSEFTPFYSSIDSYASIADDEKPSIPLNNGSDKRRLYANAWFDRFEELKKYKDEHGNCCVPQKYEKNPSLGIWVNKQRMEYKLLQDGQKSSMTQERLKALQELGFVWAKRKGQATWDAKFLQLLDYKKEHGDCLIPTKYSKDPALGRW